MIWDDHQSRCIGELSFHSEVRGIRLRRDRTVVILAQKIFIYNFADLKLSHQIETIANPEGGLPCRQPCRRLRWVPLGRLNLEALGDPLLSHLSVTGVLFGYHLILMKSTSEEEVHLK